MNQTLPIPFPFRGIDENFSFTTQPSLTAREGENVRSIDPKTGRTRGGQRSGLSAAFADASVSGLNQVKDLSFITYNKKVIEFAEGDPTTFEATDPDAQSGTPPVEWTIGQDTTNENPTSSKFVRDDEGNLYFVGDGSMVVWSKYTASGELAFKAERESDENQNWVQGIQVDEFDSVFLVGLYTSTPVALRVEKWARDPDGPGYTRAWTATLDSPNQDIDSVPFFFLDGDRLITVEIEAIPADLQTYETQVSSATCDWAQSTKRLVATVGTPFSSYTYRAGDAVVVTGGTPAVTTSPVRVASKISSTEIELEGDIHGVDSTGVSVDVERRPTAFVRTYSGMQSLIGPAFESALSEFEIPVYPIAGEMGPEGELYLAFSNRRTPPGSGDFYGENRIDLHRYDDNALTWTVNSYELPFGATYTAANGGVGSGVALGQNGELYSVGPPSLNTAAPNFSSPITFTDPVLQNVHRIEADTGVLTWSDHIRRNVDVAITSYSVGADFDNAFVSSGDPTPIGIAVDASGDAYIPTNKLTVAHDTNVGDGRIDKLRIYARGGTLKYGIQGEADGQICSAVAVPQTNPNYLSDPVDLAEFVYVHQTPDNGETAPKSVYAYRLVNVSFIDTGQPRGSRVVGVANGNIRVLDDTGSNEIDLGGENTGEGALDPGAPTIFSTEHFGKLYYTDGLSYAVYDPRSTTDGGLTANGGVTSWASTSGKLPARCRLIETWRGRVVLSGDPEDPQNWYMSGVSDATKWDFSPSVPTAGDAISGNTTRAGLSPDLVNALVPYNDDLLVLGGDHQLWVLRGDPLTGGAFDLISDVTGMAWGRPWCKDPAGRLYFFGSRGGVYVMAGATPVPQRLSRDRIERQLQDEVDLGSNYVRLFWNYRDEGLHVFQFPYGAVGSAPLKSWFWDAKNDAWWVDTFDVSDDEDGNSGYLYQPTAGLVADGDLPNDRKLYLGLGTGAVRMWDEAANSDAGRRIDSFVTIGPMTPSTGSREFRFNQFQANLASDQNGCTAELISSDETDRLEEAQHRFQLVPGRNPYKRLPMRGSAAWLRLRNGALNERWAYESASIRASVMGRARRRAC